MKNLVMVIGMLGCMACGNLSASAKLTLEECRQLAKENYPLIQKYDLIEQSSDLTIENLNRNYLPHFQVAWQSTYQSDVAKMPDALTQILTNYGYDYKGLSKSQHKLTLDLNQIVYDGGVTAWQKKAANAETNLQQAKTDVDLHVINERIDNLFFGILLIDANIRLNQESQITLKSNQDKLEAQLESGVATTSDINTIKAEYLKAKQNEDELNYLRTGYAKTLALFTGLSEADFSELQKPEAEMPESLDNNRPEINLFNARIRQSETKSKLLDAQTRPTLSLFGQASYGYPSLNMFDDMFDRSFKLNGIVGVRLAWNLGSLYTKKNDKRKIALAIDDAQNDMDVFLFNSKLQTTQQQSDIEKYRVMLSKDDEIIALRESVRKATENKLENGIIDTNNLLMEISQENQAKIEKAVHEINMLQKIYELRNTIQ